MRGSLELEDGGKAKILDKVGTISKILSLRESFAGTPITGTES
jgi:hypothetical protein